MKGSKEDAKTFNAYLDTLVNQLYNCHKVLLENELHITAEILRNAFVGKSARPRMLVEIFKAYIGDIEKLIGIDYKSQPTKNMKIA